MPPTNGQGEGGDPGTNVDPGAGGGDPGANTDPGAGGGGGEGGSGGEGGERSFVESIQDESLREWVGAKGWKDSESVVKSAYNLEKMVGAPADEVIRLPKGADAEAKRGVLSRLGLPEKPDEYEIPLPENMPVDEGYVGWAKEAFHKAGLTAEQAKTVAEQYNEYIEGKMGSQQQDYDAQVQADMQALQREWGNGFDRQMRLAQNAAEQLGFTQEVIDAIESTSGYAGTMKFMADLGRRLGEDNFVRGEQSREGFHGQMTPQEAKQAWMSMGSDPEQMKALRDNQHPQHKEMLAKKSRLFQIMHPEG